MAVKHLITWGIGYSTPPDDYPKYLATHGMDISEAVAVTVTVKTYQGWLDTKGPNAATD